MAINICIVIFSLIYYDKNIDKEEKHDSENEMKEYSFYCLLQLISTIIAWYNDVLPLLNRIRWSTGLSVIILIPMIIKKEKNIKLRIIYVTAIIILYSIYCYYTIGIKNANNVLPYLTIFSRGTY